PRNRVLSSRKDGVGPPLPGVRGLRRRHAVGGRAVAGVRSAAEAPRVRGRAPFSRRARAVRRVPERASPRGPPGSAFTPPRAAGPGGRGHPRAARGDGAAPPPRGGRRRRSRLRALSTCRGSAVPAGGGGRGRAARGRRSRPRRGGATVGGGR